MRPPPGSMGGGQVHELDPSMLPLHWRQSVDDADVPSSAFFDYPCPVGPPPSARWSHAHAAVGDRVFVFGGETTSGMQNNAYVFDAGGSISAAHARILLKNCRLHIACRLSATGGLARKFVPILEQQV